MKLDWLLGGRRGPVSWGKRSAPSEMAQRWHSLPPYNFTLIDYAERHEEWYTDWSLERTSWIRLGLAAPSCGPLGASGA